MDLLPIRMAFSEGPVQSYELFFIDGSRFSPKYFLANITPLIPTPAEKEESSTNTMEGLFARVYSDIEVQIRKYSADVSRFLMESPSTSINVSLDFRLDNLLRIEDRLTLQFPIGDIPEIYARDLFQAYSLPEGEILVLFTFYVREEILNAIKKQLHGKERDAAEVFQANAPEICINTSVDKLSQNTYIYDSLGKATMLKEGHERRKKKKAALQ